ncbi:MAG: YHS domain-containing protein [Spirochaetia bacterium]|jgi:Cu+-exporting ATPase
MRGENMGTDPSKVKDVVCGMMIDPATAAATRRYEGTKYYFCAHGCAKAFDADPKKYIQAGK